MARREVSTVNMTHEEWLALRRKSIGGSDAGAVIGLSQYASPYSVWADKTGRVPDKEDNEAMRIGRDLEAYVAERWMEETGKHVRRRNSMIYNDEYPFAHADVDRMVDGERAGLECKTTSTLDVQQFKTGEFPTKYYAQCVHYMAITGCERWYLAVLVFGKGFFTYTLERDQDEIDALMAAEREFWEYVMLDTPPIPDGAEATTEALKTIYGSEEAAGRIDLLGREALFDERKVLVEQIATLNARKDEIENIIKNDMGSCAEATCGKFSVSWKTSKGRKTFSVQGLAHDHPEIDISQYYETGNPYRIFKIKEGK